MRLLMLLVMLGTSAGSSPAANAIQILTPGEHHGNEVPDDAAGTWLALVREGTASSLRRVHVSVVTVKDEIVDEGDAMTGKRVDVAPAVEPIVLLRGIAGMRPGRVATAIVDGVVYTDQPLTARLGDRPYEFSLRCEPQAPVEGQRQDRCGLTLRSDSIEQVLFTYSAYYEGDHRIFASEEPPRVLWAGDLNRDGKLDVLLDTSDHYNVSAQGLYLSTREPGVLVREAASYMATGC